jgi:hypothetical protein
MGSGLAVAPPAEVRHQRVNRWLAAAVILLAAQTSYQAFQNYGLRQGAALRAGANYPSTEITALHEATLVISSVPVPGLNKSQILVNGSWPGPALVFPSYSAIRVCTPGPCSRGPARPAALSARFVWSECCSALSACKCWSGGAECYRSTNSGAKSNGRAAERC